MISVAMATYNGEKYLREQVESILMQLGPKDEIVISDDGSTDKTKAIIEAMKDARIRLVEGPRRGVKQNFGKAISECKGEVIFLSDQDDVWMPNKIAEVMETMRKTEADLVLHDAEVVSADGKKVLKKSFMKWRGTKTGFWRNFMKNSYIGCCMAFKSSMKKWILPIPEKIEMHDQWIGLMVERHGKVVVTEEALIKYRRHEENVTEMKHYGIGKMVGNRIRLLGALWGR